MQRYAKVVLKSVVFSENQIGVRTEIVCDALDEPENESGYEYNSSSSDSESESGAAQIRPLTKQSDSSYPVQILVGEYASDESSSSCSSFRSCSPNTTTAVPNIVNISSIKSKLAALETKLLSTLAKTQRGLDALYDCPTLPTQRIGD